jgi:hypothetical protein
MLVHRRLVLVWRASLSTFFLSPFCVFLCFLGGVLSRTKPGVGPPPGKSEGGGGCGRWLSTDALFLLGVFWLGISPALRFFWSVSTNFFADGLAQVPRLWRGGEVKKPSQERREVPQVLAQTGGGGAPHASRQQQRAELVGHAHPRPTFPSNYPPPPAPPNLFLVRTTAFLCTLMHGNLG